MFNEDYRIVNGYPRRRASLRGIENARRQRQRREKARAALQQSSYIANAILWMLIGAASVGAPLLIMARYS